MIAFICEEGMARLCTVRTTQEDYQEPTSANLSNSCMHLSNYSINKTSPGYIRSDELVQPSQANKQTLTSIKSTFEEMGLDWDNLWGEIKDLVAKSLISFQPYLAFSRSEAVGKSTRKPLRGFQILGFDVLIDARMKPWLLEINNQPSLNIDFESEHYAGPDQLDRSLVDEVIKTTAVKGAILIGMKPLGRQVQLDLYQNYTRVLPMKCRYDGEIELLSRLWSLFDHLTGVRASKYITAGRFRK